MVEEVAVDPPITDESPVTQGVHATNVLSELIVDLRKMSRRTFVLVSCNGVDRDCFIKCLRGTLQNGGWPCLEGRFDRVHEQVEPFRSVLIGFVQSIWQEIDLNAAKIDEAAETILESVDRFVRDHWRNVFESNDGLAPFRSEIAAPDLGDSVEELFSVLESMSVARVRNWIPKLLEILRSAKGQDPTLLLDNMDVASEPSQTILHSILSETHSPSLFFGFYSEDNSLAVEDFVSRIAITNNWHVVRLSSGDERFRNFREAADREENEERVASMPESVQEVMKIAACFGRFVPFPVLQAVVSQYDLSVNSDLLAQHGLVRRHHFGEDEFYFASCFISPSIYSEIEDKPRIHLSIARCLVEKGILEVGRYRWYLNFVPFHIHRGLDAVLSEERYRLLEVCLEQGGKAVKQTQFVLAWAWIDVGLRLLDRNCWKEEYHLTLSVVSCAVEVAYAKGDHVVVLDQADRILRNARGIDDTLMAHVMKSYSYDAVGRDAEALECCLSTLNELGEAFCKNPSKIKVALRYKGVKKLIQRNGIHSLRFLPPMSDARALSKMQLLAAAVASAFRPRPVLTALLVIRMVELTLEHGACALSSYALCVFGTLVVSYGREAKDGYRYGEVALALLHRFKSREWVPRVYMAAHSTLFGWDRPLEENLAPLKLSFQAGMCTGDTNVSTCNSRKVLNSLADNSPTGSNYDRQYLYVLSTRPWWSNQGMPRGTGVVLGRAQVVQRCRSRLLVQAVSGCLRLVVSRI